MQISLCVGSAVLLGVCSFSRHQEGRSKFAPHGTTKLAVRKSFLNPHPHCHGSLRVGELEVVQVTPDHLLEASFETFIGFEDGWVACTGSKSNSYCFVPLEPFLCAGRQRHKGRRRVNHSLVYECGFELCMRWFSGVSTKARCELDALPIPVAGDLIQVCAVFAARCLSSSYADVEVPRARAIHLREPLEAPQQHASALSLGRLDERLLGRRPWHDGIGPLLIQAAAHTF
ncbi:hypothetical protein EDD85DRAFT_940804 [Armillaria nabsnona]|nr:hypothetical protein EDD85DRAFT_940804 [Armillaria nabsnona]